MATNSEVKQAFMNQREARAANLHSTGSALWSYGWWEVARWVDGEVILRNGPSYSMTTATKHRSGLVGKRAKLTTPTGQAYMNL